MTALRMLALETMGENKKNDFMDVVKKTLGTPESLAAVCKDIQRIGIPTYHPRYMIQHGMGAFTQKTAGDTGLVADFDTATAWKKSLDTYLHCPGL